MFGAIILKMGTGRGWAAVNRRDLEPLLKYVTDESVMEVPGRPPWGGTFVGKAAWRAWFEAWFAGLASFRFRVLHEALTNPFALGFTNTILTEFELEGTTRDGRTFRGRGVDVSEMRGGKYVADRTYVYDLEGEEQLRSTMAPPASRVRRGPDAALSSAGAPPDGGHEPAAPAPAADASRDARARARSVARSPGGFA